MARTLVDNAIDGDTTAARECFDRMDGKVPQGVNETGQVRGNVTFTWKPPFNRPLPPCGGKSAGRAQSSNAVKSSGRQPCCNSSGSLAMFTAIRHASFAAGEQVRRRAPPRLLLIVDECERLTVGVADDEAGVGFLTTLSA